MDTQQHGREDRPNRKNPEEVDFTEPGKEIKAQDKIDIVQSELGREQSQDPADEHIEHELTQIDDQTRDLHVNNARNPQQHHDDDKRAAGYMNDETSADRDTGNSNKDGWEESRTSRHK